MSSSSSTKESTQDVVKRVSRKYRLSPADTGMLEENAEPLLRSSRPAVFLESLQRDVGGTLWKAFLDLAQEFHAELALEALPGCMHRVPNRTTKIATI